MTRSGMAVTTSGVHYFLIIQLTRVNYSTYTTVSTPQDIHQMFYCNTFEASVLKTLMNVELIYYTSQFPVANSKTF